MDSLLSDVGSHMKIVYAFSVYIDRLYAFWVLQSLAWYLLSIDWGQNMVPLQYFQDTYVLVRDHENESRESRVESWEWPSVR